MPLFNDGGIKYGSRKLQIPPTTGPFYICDDIEIRRPVKKIRVEDEEGKPRGQVGIEDWVEGSATMQLTETAIIDGLLGKQFTETFDAGIGAETFYITELSQAEQKDQDKKVKISFDLKLNA